jgi:hypothetical protein
MQPQESTSPPTWAQTLLQQMAQTQAMQNEERERRTLHDAAQEERIRRLEAMLEQQVLLTTPTTTTTITNEERTTPIRTESEIVTETQRIEVIQRPRPRLPDPAMFAGSSSEWPSWRTVIENKLAVDGEAIGSSQDQFAYVFSRLEKMALKNTNSFVKMQQNNREPQQLLNYLENIYGDPNIKARAARRLHLIRQREDQSFARFLPHLEKEFADAGAFEWPDEPKRQVLLASLNSKITETLRYRGVPSTFSELIARLHEISADNDTLDINRTRNPRAIRPDDEMDWTPTVRVNRTEPRTKPQRSEAGSHRQARWVGQDELDQRRSEGKCLRCGKLGHFIASCTLSPAQPPSRTRVATSSGRKRHNHTMYVKKTRLTSDDESVIETPNDEETTTDDDSGKE